MCHDDAEVGDHVGGGRGASASSVGKIQDPKDKRGGARNPPQKVVLPSTLDFLDVWDYTLYTQPPPGVRGRRACPRTRARRKGPAARAVRVRPRAAQRPQTGPQQQAATRNTPSNTNFNRAHSRFLVSGTGTGTKSSRNWHKEPKRREPKDSRKASRT